MIIGFKKQFKQPILDGVKIHTFREDASNRWKAGKDIHMATGVRSKNYHCFKRDYCHSIQEVEIKYFYSNEATVVRIYVDSVEVGFAVMVDCVIKTEAGLFDSIARNDGFKDVNDFLEWFSEDWKGKIIHWTKRRY